ncbi:SUMF1/EgtB/PvdO family nonheme iron enzyme [Treponema sp.]|uniref:SUMF1/EgtB/PvdO family nonheme iron enzyme n=1 Tax=Treponema sp. TaxID=166 RepID=UPI00298EB37E|nr:SUMF1/EgtB/PvdO family nonheme iron enzyme [Treponema sp.]MCR5612937.1 SUMF1/EgtB/PvdO family nonheme iron enzyme [Treponema sp.]
MKNCRAIFYFIIVVSLFFFSCSKKEIKNPVQFVEIDITDEEENKKLHLYVSRTEITQSQYEQITGANPSLEKDADLPVTNISYEDACRFCNKLNKTYGFKETYKITENSGRTSIEQIEGSQGFRLLTPDESILISKKSDAEKPRVASKKRNNFYDDDNNNQNDIRIHKVAHTKPDNLGLFEFKENALEYIFNSSNLQTPEKTSFRICCSASIDKSKLNLLLQKDVEKENEKWFKTNLEKLFSKIEFVKCNEYSYKTAGENADRSRNEINIFVSSVNAAKTEISTELYNFVMEGKLYDGLTKEGEIDESLPKTDLEYTKAIEFCNRLSQLCGLTPCYVETKKIELSWWDKSESIFVYECNPKANGYRLPTKAEYISFEAQNNSNEEINFDETHWNWTDDSFTEQLYTIDMYNPVNNNNQRQKVIYRYAGKGRTPIANKIDKLDRRTVKEIETPLFCLRLFQSADTKQFEEYEKRQEETRKKTVKELFNSLVTMNFYEGGLKSYSTSQFKCPDAEIADYELSEKCLSNYLYKTITGKFLASENSVKDEATTIFYDDAVDALNHLSRLLDLEECYIKKDEHWECDYTKNGYRLPTLAECMNVIMLEGKKFSPLCNDYFISKQILIWETSFPHGIDYFQDFDLYHTTVENGYSLDVSYRNSEYIFLCRTKDTSKMKELLKKNKEEKKLLASQMDTYLKMMAFTGKEHSMTYYDAEAKKQVTKKGTIKPFYIQQSKFNKQLAQDLLYEMESSSKNGDFAEEKFIETLIICNKLSIIANLTPCYKINDKYILDNTDIQRIEDNHLLRTENYIPKNPDFGYTITYDAKADGYQLCSEIEWDYAGSSVTNKDDFKLIHNPEQISESEWQENVLYLMNTTSDEWCYDKGPVYSFEFEKGGYNAYDVDYANNKQYGTYETRVVRAHCGKDEEEYTSSGYYSSSTYKYPKRNTHSITSTHTFRVIRYQ